MRITTLCFSALLFTSLTNAQVTVTQNDMPHAGDELFRTRAVPNPLLNINNTGPNTTWNYTNLVAQGQDDRSYQTVGSTNIVYSLVYADIFLNGNRANHVTDGVDIPFNELLPIEDPYTFYYRSSSVYRKVGYGAEVAGIPLPITMDQQDVIYQLPLNFGNTSTSNSSYSIDVPTLAYYGYSQQRVNVVDGWGTINTPAGSFNALRVKTTITGRDSIQVDQLSLGFAIERPLITEYKWLSPGRRVPVLQINTVDLFGAEVITEVFFFDEERTLAVTEPLANSFCPGDQLQVNYTKTGVFNQGGFLVAANVFRAQLSDASGSFANPVNIGSVTSVESGSINATIPALTPPGTGYRIRVVATNPAFTGISNTFDITIGATPQAIASAGGPVEFCAGSSVQLEADTDPVYVYQWQLEGTDIPGATSSTLDAVASGSYQVVVSTACGAATSDPVAVLVNALPEHALVAPADPSTCVGVPVSFSGSDLSGQSDLAYQWLQDGQAVVGAISSEFSTADAGVYSLQVTNTVTGCNFTTAAEVLAVEIVPVPTAVALGSTTVCDGATVALEASGADGATYQWYMDGEAIAGADAAEFGADASGSYSVIATSASGCTSDASEEVQVTIDPLPTVPVVNALGATTFCAGGEVTLSATGDADVAWQWYLDGTPIQGATDPELTVDASGAYGVLASNTFGCGVDAAVQVEVVVEPIPQAPAVIAADAVVFCEGNAVTLIASGVNGATYQWTLDGVPIAGANMAQFLATQAGDHAAVSVSSAGCISPTSNTIAVTVNALPSTPVVAAVGPTEFCAGNSVELVATGDPGSAFEWYLDGSSILGAGGAGYTANATGAYSAIATDAIDVEVEPLPAAPTLTPLDTTTFCAGGAVVIVAASDAGADFQWYVNGAAIPGATAEQYLANASGAYSAVATSASGCTSAVSWPTMVMVNALPSEPTLSAAGPTSFCEGGDVELIATADAGTQLQWTVDGVDIDGAEATELTVATSGAYAVTATGANGCSATSGIAMVFANAIPASVDLTALGSTTICAGSAVDLQAGIAPGISYEWYLDGELIPGITSQTYAADMSGVHTVVAVSAEGCAAEASNSVDVTVNPLPSEPLITLTESPEFCAGSSTTLVAVADPGVTFQWTMNGADIPGAIASQHTVAMAGDYTLVITDANGCSAAAVSGVTVVVNELPDAPEVSLDFDVLSATGNGPFQWSFNGTPIPGATEADLTVTSNGVYTVSTTNEDGCSATSEPFTVSTVGIDEAVSVGSNVYPNPNNGQFTIQLGGVPGSTTYYTVHDATGRLVQQGALVSTATVVELSGARSGMYFLQVVQQGVNTTHRVVVGH